MQWIMVFKYIGATGKETMCSDLTFTSLCLGGSVKVCWVHVYTLDAHQCVLLLKWCLMTSKHFCSDWECFTFKALRSVCIHLKNSLYFEGKNKSTPIFIMPRNYILGLNLILFINWFCELFIINNFRALTMALLHGLSAKRSGRSVGVDGGGVMSDTTCFISQRPVSFLCYG